MCLYKLSFSFSLFFGGGGVMFGVFFLFILYVLVGFVLAVGVVGWGGVGFIIFCCGSHEIVLIIYLVSTRKKLVVKECAWVA